MGDQVLPNDILHLILSQLDPVRFMLRKVPRLNSEWKNWASNTIRSLTIHPRDNYKLKIIDEIYPAIIKNTSLTFPNVTELSISTPQTGQLSHLLAKFPKLDNQEKLKLHLIDELHGRSVEISEIPANNIIKELIIESDSIDLPNDENPNPNPNPTFKHLEIYSGPTVPGIFKCFPTTLKELYIATLNQWDDPGIPASDLIKFTSLETLHVKRSINIVEYLKTSPKTLKDLLVTTFEENEVPYFLQENLPALKRLQFYGKNIDPNYLATLKNMEIVDRLDMDSNNFPYDDRFLKNNRDLIRLRLGQQRHMSDLNYMNNLKELILYRVSYSSTTFKTVFAIKSLEKLQLGSGFIMEDTENLASKMTPNYNIKELKIRGVTGLPIFMRIWAHLLCGLVEVDFSVDAFKEEIYSTYMKNWTKLEKFKLVGHSTKFLSMHLPVFPKLREFDAEVAVDESFFSTLAQCPDLEIARSFQLNAGSTSSFLIENHIYGFLKASKSLYRLSFLSSTPFKLNSDRVATFTMPEAEIYVSYKNGKVTKLMFAHRLISGW